MTVQFLNQLQVSYFTIFEKIFSNNCFFKAGRVNAILKTGFWLRRDLSEVLERQYSETQEK